jgi:hypothetical protein
MPMAGFFGEFKDFDEKHNEYPELPPLLGKRSWNRWHGNSSHIAGDGSSVS